MQTGWIDESFEQYKQDERLNWSSLKNILISPKNFKMAAKMTTKAMTMGTLVHTLILDKDMRTVVIRPKGNSEFAAWKKEKNAEFETSFTTELQFSQHFADLGLILTDNDTFNSAKMLAATVHTNPKAVEIIENSKCEVSGYTKTSKIRCDLIWDEKATIFDIKTTKDASPEGFIQEIKKYLYYGQVGYYLKRANEIMCEEYFKKFGWIVIENTGLHCAVYYADDFLDLGRFTVEKALRIYDECTLSGIWNGHEDQILTCPSYLMKEMDYE